MKIQVMAFVVVFAVQAVPAQTVKISDRVKQDGIGFGFLATLRGEYRISSMASLGLDFSFSRTQASFQTPDYQNTIPEVIHYQRNVVCHYSFALPLVLKIEKKDKPKALYCYTGVGLNYALFTSREVDVIQYPMQNPNSKQSTQVTNGSFTYLNNQNLGAFMLIGIGKKMCLKNVNFFTEICFRQDHSSWAYPTWNDPVDRQFKIRAHTLSLGLGTYIN
jgi:hypothetical protein